MKYKKKERTVVTVQKVVDCDPFKNYIKIADAKIVQIVQKQTPKSHPPIIPTKICEGIEPKMTPD